MSLSAASQQLKLVSKDAYSLCFRFDSSSWASNELSPSLSTSEGLIGVLQLTFRTTGEVHRSWALKKTTFFTWPQTFLWRLVVSLGASRILSLLLSWFPFGDRVSVVLQVRSTSEMVMVSTATTVCCQCLQAALLYQTLTFAVSGRVRATRLTLYWVSELWCLRTTLILSCSIKRSYWRRSHLHSLGCTSRDCSLCQALHFALFYSKTKVCERRGCHLSDLKVQHQTLFRNPQKSLTYMAVKHVHCKFLSQGQSPEFLVQFSRSIGYVSGLTY
jgi:hypothetical protein